jgi:glycogen synthase
MNTQYINDFRSRVAQAQFFMLRYETEFTPCTGITAVTKQERRYFKRGVMIAPWCSQLRRAKPEDDPIASGKVEITDWSFDIKGKTCRVLKTTDDFAPIFFLDVEGRFQGIETPYDLQLTELKKDALYFGLAVDRFLREVGSPQQFVWGADWESAPALFLVKDRHHVSLTLHNTFDECLESESVEFGKTYAPFQEYRDPRFKDVRTALEVGFGVSDVVTTVNRGFAYGMRVEPLQQKVMASHIAHLLTKVVGINNAAFAPVQQNLIDLKKKLQSDFESGEDELLKLKALARTKLPSEIEKSAQGKVIIVSMGRRVAQKQHDVLVESVRQILSRDKGFPMFVVFSTIHGDDGSPARLERIQKLQREFPSNVSYTDGRLSYYSALMEAADYNCMPSLYEPHGGAYEGTVIPIARAVDGLAEQICGFAPKGQAAVMNSQWHAKDEAPTGFLFRETTPEDAGSAEENLRCLIALSPSPENGVFTAMRDSLTETLREAVALRREQLAAYARLVMAAIEKQEGSSWSENLGGMIALIEEARVRREIAR